MLISPEPFSADDVRTLEAEAERLGFPAVLTPEMARDDLFEGLASADSVDDTIARLDEDVSAPTDNRPYFFQMANLETIFSSAIFDDHYLVRPVRVLLLLSLAVVVLAATCIGLPLLIASRRWPEREVDGMPPFYLFFAGIGLAFLLVEVAQLQRLILYLGHPTHALSVVLFSLLLSSGIGSMLSERLTVANRTAVVGALAALLGVVAAAGVATPIVIGRFDSVTMDARIVISVALLMPMGLMMGLPFPLGMRIAEGRAAPTAYLWGVNGATSVCASVVGTAIALLFGISAAFWAGAACYALAAIALSYAVVRPVHNETLASITNEEPVPTTAG
jgi:hypothetical protein